MRAVPVAPLVLDQPVILPIALEAAQCGFPSPAQDYFSGDLDLAEHLIRDRVSTYIWRAAGESMINAGMHDGDLLLVDRGITPVAGHIVVAVIDAEYAVKRLDLVQGRPVLRSENPAYPDLILHELSELTIWGVVTWVLHKTDVSRPIYASHRDEPARRSDLHRTR